MTCFAQTGSFAEGCLMAANLGGDADSNAAIYGQLAGAFYGESGIPADWLAKLYWADEIRARARALWQARQRK
jgi:ADP-ribosylglycohydrolase